MKIEKAYPPNYKDIIATFPFVKEHKGVIFTYGDTCYVPSGAELPDHLIVHEETHTKQQGDNPAEWWKRYLADKDFRFEQEVEAYGNQYRFFSQKNGNSQKKKFLFNIASDLASPIYELEISYSQAETAIRKNSVV